MIVIHPAVVEQYKALRAMRMALAEGELLQSQQMSLQVLALQHHGTPRGDRLAASFEQVHRAANENIERINELAARREAADAAYGALSKDIQLAWLRQAIPA